MALQSQGTKLQFETAVPGTWTTVGEVVSIGGPSQSRGEIDRTHLNSPGGFMQFLPGMRDGGSVPFTVNFDPSDATQNATAGLLKQFSDDDLHNWRIVFPTAATVELSEKVAWEGYLSSFGLTGMEVNGLIRADCEIRVAGALDWGV